MSIGNIHSSVRNKPTNNCWILVAQLPIPPSCKKFKEATEMETRALDRIAIKENRSEEWKAFKAKKVAFDKEGVSRPDYERNFQRMKANALGCVIRDVLSPLSEFRDDSEGIELHCADGNLRRGYPVVAGWLADYQEYNKLYTTSTKGCCLCEVSEAQLGDNYIASRRCWKKHTEALQTRAWLMDRLTLLEKASVDNDFHKECCLTPQLNFPTRKGDLHKERVKVGKQLSLSKYYFELRQSKPIDNALWKSGVADMADAWKPDLLHTIYEGMFSHLLTSLKHFLVDHKRLGMFEEAWLRTPAYDGVSAPRNSVFEEEQRTGKTQRDNLRRILPALVIALEKPSIEEEFPFFECISATRYLVDFSLICTYKYHTEKSLGYLRTYLEGFHRHKHVFDVHRPTPTADKTKAVSHDGEKAPGERFSEKEGETVDRERQDMDERRQLAKERAEQSKSFLQRVAAELLRSGDKEELKRWLQSSDEENDSEVWEFRAEEIVDRIESISNSIEERYLDHGACWKIPKLHILSHFSECIERFGYLQQYSSEIGETLHKGIKEAYRHSNRRDQTKQILQFHTRRFAIRMRELNLVQLARKRQHEEDIQEALSLYAEKRDKLLVAKLNREGRGSIKDTGYFEERLQAVAEDATLANQTHTDAPFDLPNPLPLFADEIKATTGYLPKARIRSAGYATLGAVSRAYDLPLLSNAVLHFLCTEKGEAYSELGLRQDHLVDLKVEVYQTLQITAKPAQSDGTPVSYRADCKGPGMRNDAIAFVDVEGDDYSIDVTANKDLYTDFGEIRVGFLRCIFRLQMPLSKHVEMLKIAGAANCGSDQCTVFDLVYINALQPERYDSYGEFIPGALLAKCTWPKALKSTKGLKNNAPHAVRRKNGGLVTEFNAVLKNVHLVPYHDSDAASRSQQSWLVNNRMDLQSWDILYSRRVEREDIGKDMDRMED